MTYKTLRTLPMVLFHEIMQTNDYSLLSDDENAEGLDIIWNDLFEEYKNRYDNANNKKIFNASREIAYLTNKYDEINLIVEALKFDANKKLIDILKEYGYKFEMPTYIEDLQRVERESNGILQKINALKKLLPPEPKETDDSKKYLIVDLMAGYTNVLGYDFDFYTISVEKFHALEKQVKNKISSVESQKRK